MPTDFGLFHISEMDIPNRILLGVVCLFIAIWARRVAVTGIETWQGTRTPVGPDLAPNPSPWAAMSNGVEGCATYLFGGTLFVSALIVAINLFFPETNLTTFALSVVRSLFDLFINVLKSVARALLA